MRPCALVLLTGLALAGCGVSDDRSQAREAAARFYDDVRRGDGSAACARLAPPTAAALAQQQGKACARAVVELELSGDAVADVEVFETNAAVRFRGGELAYVDRRAGGWKVSAAGCRPEPAGPAQCEVQD